MNHPEQSNEIGKREDFRMKTSKRIEGYLREGLPVSEMAQILNARDFVTREVKKGKEFTHFKVKEYVDDLISKGANLQLPETIIQSGELILPPDAGEIQQATTGENKFEKPKYIPRTQFLMELLSDMEIPYSVVSGKNDPNMVRKLSYQLFILPENSRIVMVNNEEGNATYIIKDIENPIENWENYSKMTKQQLQELGDKIEKLPYLGNVDSWKQEVKSLLLQDSNFDRKKYDRGAELGLNELLDNGWGSAKKIAIQLKIDRDAFISMAEKHLENNPTLMREFGGKKYYNPDILKKIEAEMLPFPPDGWKLISQVARDLGIDFYTVENIAKKIEGDGWKLKGRFRSKTSLLGSTYLSPDLIDKITTALSYQEDISSDWESALDISKRLKVDKNTVIDRLKKYDDNSGEDIKKLQKVKGQGLAFYASPKMSRIIKEEILKPREHDKLPEGWFTIKSMANRIGVSESLVSKMAGSYRSTNPEWFGEFWKKNISVQCFSDELERKIEADIGAVEYAPEGWKNSNEIYKELKREGESISFSFVHNIFKAYESKNPGTDDIKIYRNKRGQVANYYSPEAIMDIMEIIKASRNKSDSKKV